MPLREFECASCGAVFEELVPMDDESSPECPYCGSKDTRRLLSFCAVRAGGASAASSCSPGGGFS